MRHWIFGYGSLIWRPDFDFIERRPARIYGWVRRFWQGSHDHRGVPEAPGRVVTLVPQADGYCDGVAFCIDIGLRDAIFKQLDFREKNGYASYELTLHFTDVAGGVEDTVTGSVYVASADNHAFLGQAPLPEMVHQILNSHGPSGSNADYLLRLDDALRELGATDPHVSELAEALKAKLR